MSDLGDELIEGMKQAVAYAEDEADADDYRVTEKENESPDAE